MTDFTAIAIIRNEARYLPEWLAFHLVQGVQRFVLYNNRSTDNFYAVLEPFADVVELIDWPLETKGQLPAYADYFDRVQRGNLPASRWVAVLDVDEFLFADELEKKPLLDVLDEFGRLGASGVGVNWMLFNGSDAHATAPDALQIEAFDRRCEADHAPNRHIKTVVDPMKVEIGRLCDPHFMPTKGPVCDELTRILPGPITMTASHARLRINHYLIRSLAEWEEKVARGRADTGTFRTPAERFDYPAPVVDTQAARYAEAVRAILVERGFDRTGKLIGKVEA